LASEEDALGAAVRYEYTPDGLLGRETGKDGSATNYEYDPVGLLTKTRYADGREVMLSYDPLRRLAEMKDALGLTKIGMDAVGRVTELTDPENQTIRYSWTPAGERESITYSDGSMVRYGYDTAGRISQVTDGQEAAAAYRYDAVGHILERMLLNGIKTEYTYGELGMVESLIHSDQTGQLDAFSYIYDPAGNRTEIQRTRRLSGGTDETSVSGYVYDSMNRLTEVSRDGALLRSYGYDALGNRIMMADAQSSVITNYEYDLLNRLIRQSGADGEQVFRYDRRGNLASVSKGGVFQKSFRFDAANRMASAVTASGDTAAYTYDGLGRRIKSVWDTAAATGREAQHEEKRYILDALKPYDNILMAYGADGADRHVWGNELVSAGNNSPGADGFDKNGFGGTDPVYYLNDELRTPVRTTDAAGGSLSHFDYDEFGVPLPQEPGGSGSGAGSGAEPFGAKSDAGPFFASLFGFAGYQPDPVTGLCYAQARYYMPEVGRFVSEDSYKGVITDIPSLNYFAYCNNNPLRFIDPSGHTWIDDLLRTWWNADMAIVDNSYKQEAANHPEISDQILNLNPYKDVPVDPGVQDLVNKGWQYDYQVDVTVGSNVKIPLPINLPFDPVLTHIGITKTISPSQMKNYDTAHAGGGAGATTPLSSPGGVTISFGIVKNFQDINSIIGPVQTKSVTLGFMGFSYSNWPGSDVQTYSFTLSTDLLSGSDSVDYCWETGSN